MLFKSQIYSLAAILDVGVLIGAIIFVVNVLRPDRYNRAAIAEFIAISDKRKPNTKKPTDLFYKDFVDLEKDIRRFLVQHNLYVPSRGIQGMSYSFRQMVEALFLNGKISKELTAQFLEINKFRNLLFHGHIEKIGDDVLDKLKKIRIKWDAAKLQ